MYTILKNTHVHVYKILAQKIFREKIIHVYVCKKLSSEKKFFLKKNLNSFLNLVQKPGSFRKFKKLQKKKFFQ